MIQLTLIIPDIDNVRLDVLDNRRYSDKASIKANPAPNNNSILVWKITSTFVNPRKSLVDEILTPGIKNTHKEMKILTNDQNST